MDASQSRVVGSLRALWNIPTEEKIEQKECTKGWVAADEASVHSKSR